LGDLPRLLIEDRDALIFPGRNHAGRKILQKRLVINLRVLHFREQLRVIDCDRELAAQHLQRVLLHAAIDPPRHSRTEQHHPGKMFA